MMLLFALAWRCLCFLEYKFLISCFCCVTFHSCFGYAECWLTVVFSLSLFTVSGLGIETEFFMLYKLHFLLLFRHLLWQCREHFVGSTLKYWSAAFILTLWVYLERSQSRVVCESPERWQVSVKGFCSNSSKCKKTAFYTHCWRRWIENRKNHKKATLITLT